MNFLYELHVNPSSFKPASPLDHWLRRNGIHTLEKLNQRLADPRKPLTYISRVPDYQFSAFIDTDNEWDVRDQLSQVSWFFYKIKNIVFSYKGNNGYYNTVAGVRNWKMGVLSEKRIEN